MTDDQIRLYSYLRVKLTGDVRLASWVDEIGSVYVAATFPEIRLRRTTGAADPDEAATTALDDAEFWLTTPGNHAMPVPEWMKR